MLCAASGPRFANGSRLHRDHLLVMIDGAHVSPRSRPMLFLEPGARLMQVNDFERSNRAVRGAGAGFYLAQTASPKLTTVIRLMQRWKRSVYDRRLSVPETKVRSGKTLLVAIQLGVVRAFADLAAVMWLPTPEGLSSRPGSSHAPLPSCRMTKPSTTPPHRVIAALMGFCWARAESAIPTVLLGTSAGLGPPSRFANTALRWCRRRVHRRAMTATGLDSARAEILSRAAARS